MNITACTANPLTCFPSGKTPIPHPTAGQSRGAGLLNAHDEALRDMFINTGIWVRHDTRTVVLNAPTTVSITVATGSKEATIAPADWNAWMAGCTLVVAGSAVDNQILNASLNVALKYPHDGVGGVTYAVVYADAITSAADVAEVLEPVRLDRLMQLSPLASPPAYQCCALADDSGFQHMSPTPPPVPVARVADTHGMPVGFRVENREPDATSPAGVRLRFYPPPAQRCSVDYHVRLLPPDMVLSAGAVGLPVSIGCAEVGIVLLSMLREGAANGKPCAATCLP